MIITGDVQFWEIQHTHPNNTMFSRLALASVGLVATVFHSLPHNQLADQQAHLSSVFGGDSDSLKGKIDV